MRPYFSLPQVVYESGDVFLEELPRLPPLRDVEFCIELQLNSHHYNNVGEQCLIENFSYKGYSPPKCTCNGIHT